MAISSYDSPNVIAGREVVPGLCTAERIEERAIEWGRNSPTFKARVLGEFPDGSDNMLIRLSWVEQAMRREYPSEIDRNSLCMGVDVARDGDDRIVFLVRDRYAVRYMEIYQHESLMVTAGRTIAIARKYGIQPELV